MVAVGAALAEELARQIRLGGVEELVDPVVDLAEEECAPSGVHARTLPVRRPLRKRDRAGLTDALRRCYRNPTLAPGER